MKFRNLVAAAAAISLSVAPAMAQSAASNLGRVTKASKESKGDAVLLGVAAVVLIAGGLAIATGNNSDKPKSP